MLRRDGSGLPWGGKGEMLTQVERISKKTILAAGLRPEPDLPSYWAIALPSLEALGFTIVRKVARAPAFVLDARH